MTYLRNIPLTTDRISLSQDDILTNFREIKTLIDENHYDFSEPDNLRGKHIFCSMPVQTNTPSILNGREVGLYCSTGKFSNQPELTVIKQNNTKVYTFTEKTFFTENASFSWTRLPSGLLIMWGYIPVESTASEFGRIIIERTINFNGVPPISYGFPAFTSIFNVKLTPVKLSQSSTQWIEVFNINDSFDASAQTIDILIKNFSTPAGNFIKLFKLNYLVTGI